MKFSELGSWLDDTLNRDCAEEWDNVGWMARPSDSAVTGITLSVDPSPEALKATMNENDNVLITHHPLIFESLDQLVEGNPTQRTLIRACREDVAIYAAHTNADSMVGGLNDVLADVLSVTNRRPIRPLEDHERAGLGRMGRLESPRTGREIQNKLENELEPTILEFVGEPSREISNVAVCSGSGGDFIDETLAETVDLYITADLKHHDVLKARSYELDLIILDHGEMESVFTEIVRERLEEDLEETLPVHTYHPDSPYQRTLPTS